MAEKESLWSPPLSKRLRKQTQKGWFEDPSWIQSEAGGGASGNPSGGGGFSAAKFFENLKKQKEDEQQGEEEEEETKEDDASDEADDDGLEDVNKDIEQDETQQEEDENLKLGEEEGNSSAQPDGELGNDDDNNQEVDTDDNKADGEGEGEGGEEREGGEEGEGEDNPTPDEEQGDDDAKADEEQVNIGAEPDEQKEEEDAKADEEVGDEDAKADEEMGDEDAKADEEMGDEDAKADEEVGEEDAKADEEVSEEDAKADEEVSEEDAKADEEVGDEDAKADEEVGEEDAKADGEGGEGEDNPTPDEEQGDDDAKADEEQVNIDAEPDEQKEEEDAKADEEMGDEDAKADEEMGDEDAKADEEVGEEDAKADEEVSEEDAKADEEVSEEDAKADEEVGDEDAKADEEVGEEDAKADGEGGEGEDNPTSDEEQGDDDTKADEEQVNVGAEPDEQEEEEDTKADEQKEEGDEGDVNNVEPVPLKVDIEPDKRRDGEEDDEAHNDGQDGGPHEPEGDGARSRDSDAMMRNTRPIAVDQGPSEAQGDDHGDKLNLDDVDTEHIDNDEPSKSKGDEGSIKDDMPWEKESGDPQGNPKLPRAAVVPRTSSKLDNGEGSAADGDENDQIASQDAKPLPPDSQEQPENPKDETMEHMKPLDSEHGRHPADSADETRVASQAQGAAAATSSAGKSAEPQSEVMHEKTGEPQPVLNSNKPSDAVRQPGHDGNQKPRSDTAKVDQEPRESEQGDRSSVLQPSPGDGFQDSAKQQSDPRSQEDTHYLPGDSNTEDIHDPHGEEDSGDDQMESIELDGPEKRRDEADIAPTGAPFRNESSQQPKPPSNEDDLPKDSTAIQDVEKALTAGNQGDADGANLEGQDAQESREQPSDEDNEHDDLDDIEEIALAHSPWTGDQTKDPEPTASHDTIPGDSAKKGVPIQLADRNQASTTPEGVVPIVQSRDVQPAAKQENITDQGSPVDETQAPAPLSTSFEKPGIQEQFAIHAQDQESEGQTGRDEDQSEGEEPGFEDAIGDRDVEGESQGTKVPQSSLETPLASDRNLKGQSRQETSSAPFGDRTGSPETTQEVMNMTGSDGKREGAAPLLGEQPDDDEVDIIDLRSIASSDSKRMSIAIVTLSEGGAELPGTSDPLKPAEEVSSRSVAPLPDKPSNSLGHSEQSSSSWKSISVQEFEDFIDANQKPEEVLPTASKKSRTKMAPVRMAAVGSPHGARVSAKDTTHSGDRKKDAGRAQEGTQPGNIGLSREATVWDIDVVPFEEQQDSNSAQQGKQATGAGPSAETRSIATSSDGQSIQRELTPQPGSRDAGQSSSSVMLESVSTATTRSTTDAAKKPVFQPRRIIEEGALASSARSEKVYVDSKVQADLLSSETPPARKLIEATDDSKSSKPRNTAVSVSLKEDQKPKQALSTTSSVSAQAQEIDKEPNSKRRIHIITPNNEKPAKKAVDAEPPVVQRKNKDSKQPEMSKRVLSTTSKSTSTSALDSKTSKPSTKASDETLNKALDEMLKDLRSDEDTLLFQKSSSNQRPKELLAEHTNPAAEKQRSIRFSERTESLAPVTVTRTLTQVVSELDDFGQGDLDLATSLEASCSTSYDFGTLEQRLAERLSCRCRRFTANWNAMNRNDLKASLRMQSVRLKSHVFQEPPNYSSLSPRSRTSVLEVSSMPVRDQVEAAELQTQLTKSAKLRKDPSSTISPNSRSKSTFPTRANVRLESTESTAYSIEPASYNSSSGTGFGLTSSKSRYSNPMASQRQKSTLPSALGDKSMYLYDRNVPSARQMTGRAPSRFQDLYSKEPGLNSRYYSMANSLRFNEHDQRLQSTYRDPSVSAGANFLEPASQPAFRLANQEGGDFQTIPWDCTFLYGRNPVFAEVHFETGDLFIVTSSTIEVFTERGEKLIERGLTRASRLYTAAALVYASNDLVLATSDGFLEVLSLSTLSSDEPLKRYRALDESEHLANVMIVDVVSVDDGGNFLAIGLSNGYVRVLLRETFDCMKTIQPVQGVDNIMFDRQEYYESPSARGMTVINPSAAVPPSLLFKLPASHGSLIGVRCMDSGTAENSQPWSTLTIGYSDGSVKSLRVTSQILTEKDGRKTIKLIESSPFSTTSTDVRGIVCLYGGSVVVTLDHHSSGCSLSAFDPLSGRCLGSEDLDFDATLISKVVIPNHCTICPSESAVLIGGSFGLMEVARVVPLSDFKVSIRRVLRIRHAGFQSPVVRESDPLAKFLVFNARSMALYNGSNSGQIVSWVLSEKDGALLALPDSCRNVREVGLQGVSECAFDLWKMNRSVRESLDLSADYAVVQAVNSLLKSMQQVSEYLLSNMFVLENREEVLRMYKRVMDKVQGDVAEGSSRLHSSQLAVKEKYTYFFSRSNPERKTLGEASTKSTRLRQLELQEASYRCAAYEVHFIRDTCIISIIKLCRKLRKELYDFYVDTIGKAKCSVKARSEAQDMVSEWILQRRN